MSERTFNVILTEDEAESLQHGDYGDIEVVVQNLLHQVCQYKEQGFCGCLVSIDRTLILKVIRRMRFLDNHYRSNTPRDEIVKETQGFISQLESFV